MRRALALSALALTTAAVGCDRNEGSGASPIIGGAASNEAAVVMLVSYPKDQSTLLTCSAALIAPKVLVTAAHCVDPMTHPDHVFGVYLGADATADATPQKLASKMVAVAKTTMHPAYDRDPPFTADIAVVELVEPLAVAPLPVATAPLPASIAGAEARIVGYGETHYDDPSYVRMEAVTKIAAIDAGDTLTVGDATHRSCVGDSGGPALTKIDGLETIVGVDSYADLAGCLEPAHYRRTDTYAEFLSPYLPPTGDGGAGGAASSSTTGAGGGSSTDDGGSGCSLSSSSSPEIGCALLAAAALAAARRRRRG